MVKCPKCGFMGWVLKHKSPVDPAKDRFYCPECKTEYTRYEGTAYENKEVK